MPWRDRRMLLLPLPKKSYRAVFDITPAELRSHGAAGLLVDLDNTLAPYGARALSGAVAHWLESLKAEGIGVLVVSNGKRRRVEGFCSRAGIEFVCSAGKPRRRGLLEGAKKLGLPQGRVAVAGDQIFTDVLGAVRCGMIPLIVNPGSMTKNPLFMLRRLIELPFILLSQNSGAEKK